MIYFLYNIKKYIQLCAFKSRIKIHVVVTLNASNASQYRLKGTHKVINYAFLQYNK